MDKMMSKKTETFYLFVFALPSIFNSGNHPANRIFDDGWLIFNNGNE